MISAPLRGTELQDLAKHSAVEVVERLAEVAAALPSCEAPEVLGQLARSMPARLAGLQPEVAMALGEVALQLASSGPRLPEDVMSQEPRLRVQWLRVGLLGRRDDAAAVVQQLGEEALLLAVTQGWSLDASPVAAALLQRMARATDARLRLRAVESIHSAVWSLAITVAEGFSLLAHLARAEEVHAVRVEAVRRLASNWLLGLPPQAARQREQLIGEALRIEAAPDGERWSDGENGDGEKGEDGAGGAREESPQAALLAGAAVAVSKVLGLRHLLAGAVTDEGLPTSRRAIALAALGTVATGDDVATALAQGPADPLGFGPAVRDFLLEAHRRGAFVREADLPAVLELFDAHAGWRGEELVRVTYLARKPLVALLGELPASDPRWLRRASILAASVGTGAHLVLAAKLKELRALAVEDDVAALSIARALLEAGGQSPELVDEDALLGWLDRLPEVVIPALRAKGGAASATRLRALVLDPFTPGRLYGQALEGLWALADDRRALLEELTKKLGPHRMALTDARFVAPRDAAVAELLAADEAYQEQLEPKEQLGLYCESGELRFLPQVRELFRELLRGYVQKALEGDFTVKRLLLPELEQQVFRYGRHLIKDGRPVRRWCEAAAETGRDLVLRLVCEWLAEEPADPICVALLEVASRHAPEGAYLRFLERYWRKGDVNVRRAALEALAMAPAGSHGLELSLGRLVDEDTDARLLVQALEAVKSLRAAWAEPLVIRALERREMGVKQAAAEALAEIGGGRAVPALVGWLARHDNESFRGSLSRALAKAAGEGRVAVLVEALGQLAHDSAAARSRELLWQALAGHLRLAAVLQLARSDDAEHRALVEGCLDGRVAVADASAEQVAAALHRARLRPPAPQPDPAKRLRIEGFSVEAAHALLAEHAMIAGGRNGRRGDPGSPIGDQASDRTKAPADGKRAGEDDAAILAAVRATLPSWISWLDGETDPSPPALALALAAVSPGEQAPRALALAERCKDRLEPADVASFVERCLAQPAVAPGSRLRALALVRALAPSARLGGLRRYRLLGKLGAVRTLADLEQALAECRVRPSAAAECEQLLGEALAIPPAPADARRNAASPGQAARATGRGKEEPAAEREARELRDAARDWTRADDNARRAWLARTVAARPLDVPLTPAIAEAPRPPPFRPASHRDLEALLATSQDGDEPERTRAARHLLSWQDASATWPRVLRAYLEGEVPLEHSDLPRLAEVIVRWPDMALPEPVEADAPELARLAALVPHLPPWSARALAVRWIAAWEAGEWSYGEILRALGQDQLLPLVVERVRAGKPQLAALLSPGSSPAMQALIELLATSAPAEAARLSSWRVKEREARATADAPLADPIAGKGLEELVALLDDKRVEKGLAVRAIHALARLGEPAIEPLGRFATDRRPQIRSAALRALRTVAPREHTLEVTTRVLAMETRRDVTLQLMASLAHGRHEPALPDLLERVLDRDPHIREGATDSLRAWGTDILPAIHREARRARPDHRRQLEALIETLGEG
jgi:HEAT repeats